MFRRLLWLLAPLALAGCKPAPVVQDADPALWVIRDVDTTIYLFGTVHALRPGLGWFDDGVKDAFDRSDELMLELVMPPQAETTALVRELGVLPQGDTLQRQLPPELAAKLRDALVRSGQPPEAMDRFEPWLAAIQLSVMPARKAGYDATSGAETVLAREAERAGKPVIGLETAREQFGYFDRLSPAAQQALLSGAIDGMPGAAALLDRIVTAWGAGDVEAIARLMNDDMTRSPELAEALLAERNRRWADRIAARMKRPGTVFVAVGAGHLAGTAALQGELARRGYRATRIAY